MTVLVTGAGGFLGNQLVGSLLRQGHRQLRLHYRREPDGTAIAAFRERYPDAVLEARSANLLSPARLRPLVEGVDIIIHAAAGKRGAAADMFLNTVVGTRNLLDAAVSAGCRRIVLVSSFAVYDSAALAANDVLDEQCPAESDGLEKGAYGFAKVQQELLFREYQARHGFEYVILRPGVIYGPGDASISSRVGLKIGPFFFGLGGGCSLPLSYVENCADAIGIAARSAPSGSIFSVVDGDLPTCRQYLAGYRRKVEKLRAIPIPHWLFVLGVRTMMAYHRRSQGQLPALFTLHLVRSMYRNFRFSNAGLVTLGWRQRISTDEGMAAAFRWCASR